MSQEGERRAPRAAGRLPERAPDRSVPQPEPDDWWAQLYDPDAPDAGRTGTADTLDERYASARRAVGAPTAAGGVGGTTSPPSDERPARRRRPHAPAGAADPAPAEPGGDVPGAGKAHRGESPRDEPPDRPDRPARASAAESPSGEAPEERLPGAIPGDGGQVPAAPSAQEPVPEPERAAGARESAAEPSALSETPAASAPAGPPSRAGRAAGPASAPPPTADGKTEAPAAAAGKGVGVPGAAGGGRRAAAPFADAALPAVDPAALAELVPDTVLDGAHYGRLALRAASSRGDAARQRGALRGDALVTARFGVGDAALLVAVLATGGDGGARHGPEAAAGQRAARELCQSVGGAVGRNHVRLAEDLRADRWPAAKSGLRRLTDRCYGKLRAQAAAFGTSPEAYTAGLGCLLLPVDPRCRSRLFFGVGEGGLFLLRDGAWQDADPAPGRDRGPTTGPAAPDEPFRFRAVLAEPGDALLLCGPGLAEPLRTEAAFGAELARRWAPPAEPPDLAGYVTDIRLPSAAGRADDRTAVTVWES